MMFFINQITLPHADLDQLLQEARTEGYDFLDVLQDDWANGSNRFNGSGEVLCGAFDRGTLIAIGGLNRDPFVTHLPMGRIRRIYVRSLWRRQGIGKALVSTLVEQARASFSAVRLRAENADAARLYESMGFLPVDDANASHIFHF